LSLAESSIANGAVATLTLNRPEAHNALSAELCDAIVATLEGIDRQPDARALLVKGKGQSFCAGADIAAVSGPGPIDFLASFERMLEAVAAFRLPTIAAIQGAALGGGLQLATVCDFRIAAIDATIGIPSSRLGIVVNFENVQRLVLLVGIARAKEILMTARTFTGEEAAAAGLVNEGVPNEGLDRRARQFAEQVAQLAPLSVQGAKRSIGLVTHHLCDARRQHPDEAAEIDRLVAHAYASADLAEGLRALAEKRDPRFQGP
jgi:enoyl-CoA hydratase/carnithine racemase